MTRYLLPLSLFLAACSGVEDPKTSDNTDPTITRPDSKPVDDSGTTDDSSTTVVDDTAIDDTQPPQADWDVIGGDAAVDALLDAFLANVGADANINWMFANTDLAQLKQLLKELISSATGGPLSYTGRDMLTAHAGMAITDAQFNSLVLDLLTAMSDLGVPYTADFSGDLPADRLMMALAGMHDDIVTDPNADQVLFNQLGGYAAVNAVVDAFVTNVGNDANINWMFANTDLVHLNDLLVEQICAATGGYCVYTGRDMVTTHAGMAITGSQWASLVDDLLAAFTTLGVPYTADFSGGLPADQLVLALASMYPDIVTDPDGQVVLFNQLGGYAAVNAVVDQFVTNVGNDATINWMFANTDLAQLNNLLVEQICAATGGYCVYTGRDMVTTHAGMAITDAQWNALVGDLLSSFTTLGVPYTADFSGGLPADQLVLALAGMYSDIVTDPNGDQVLFNQLGGYASLSAVLDQFLVNVGGDSRINGRFANTDLARLHGLLLEQVCDATGGYCVYSGLDMLTAHTGMGITVDEFNAMVEDLLAALDTFSVPYTAGTYNGGLPADSLIQALAAMQPDIVGH